MSVHPSHAYPFRFEDYESQLRRLVARHVDRWPRADWLDIHVAITRSARRLAARRYRAERVGR